MEVRIGDGSGNEEYRTCSVCSRDCEPEIFDGGEGVGIRVAFSCREHCLQGVADPFEGNEEGKRARRSALDRLMGGAVA